MFYVASDYRAELPLHYGIISPKLITQISVELVREGSLELVRVDCDVLSGEFAEGIAHGTAQE